MALQYNHSTNTPSSSPRVFNTGVHTRDVHVRSFESLLQEQFPQNEKVEEDFGKEHYQKCSKECSMEFLIGTLEECSSGYSQESSEECSEDICDESSIKPCAMKLSSCTTCIETLKEEMFAKFLHSPMTPYNSPDYSNHQKSISEQSNVANYSEIFANELIEILVAQTS